MMKVWLVEQCCDDEYGCMEAVAMFDSEEKARQYVQKRIADREDDDDFDGEGKYYPWFNEEGVDYFSIREFEVQ